MLHRQTWCFSAERLTVPAPPHVDHMSAPVSLTRLEHTLFSWEIPILRAELGQRITAHFSVVLFVQFGSCRQVVTSHYSNGHHQTLTESIRVAPQAPGRVHI